MNTLVIDIGTSSMRGILYRENGEKVFTKQIRYQPVHDGEGTVSQDPKEFEDALVIILRAFSSRTELFQAEIDVISVTSQRSAIIPVGGHGEPLMDAIMWQDTRNSRICAELSKENERVRSISGADVNCVFSGGKMSYIARECPDIYRRTSRFVTIPEYLIYKMTGVFTTDWTYASRSNLFDLKSLCWSTALLDLFGIDKNRLSDPQAPGEICGYITEAFAEKSGVRSGTPVISAGGDQQCAAVGQGAYREGTLSVVTGTGAYLVAPCRKAPADIPGGMIVNCASVAGDYILEANVLTCSCAFDWFLGTFYDWDEPDYRFIGEELQRLSGRRSTCICVPYFQGRSTPEWNPRARATFHNLTLGTGREELLKSMMESIFMEIGNNIDVFRRFTFVENANISGGLTKSPVLNQMLSDVLGLLLLHCEDPESTGNGAFMVAMHRMAGLSYDELYARVRRNTKVTRYEPDPGLHAEYLKQRDEMNELYSWIKDDLPSGRL